MSVRTSAWGFDVVRGNQNRFVFGLNRTLQSETYLKFETALSAM